MTRLSFLLPLIYLVGWGSPGEALADPETLWVQPRAYEKPKSTESRSSMEPRLRSALSPSRGEHIQLGPLNESRLIEPADPFSSAPVKIGVLREVKALASASQVMTALAWTTNPDGFSLGHLTIRSSGAAALRMGLRFDLLPAGVELRFHDENLKQIEVVSGIEIQRILDANQKAGDTSEDALIYWSPVIQGESLGLEVSLPPGTTIDQLGFRITGVSHLTLDPAKNEPQSLIPKAAESCNLDSRCYANWSPITNAVARITFVSGGYSYLCTGTLLNDTSSSNTPYFLTANHCISTQTVASTLSSYWFYYSSSCNSGRVFNGMTQVSGGASLLYNSSTTDASFLRLSGSLPSGVWFSGWTTSIPGIGISSTGLHNPTGDLQKISFWLTDEYETCQAAGSGTFTCSPSNQSSATFINVAQISGTTEGGSSGSGVFLDNNQYLFGQLYGGSASCTDTTGSTVYGLFGKTYTNGNLGQWLASGKQAQTVTLAVAPSSIAVNQTATATASASSGLTVTLASTTPSVCTLSGTTVTGVSPGTCTVSATQAGNTSYESATNTSSITVTKANQTISLSVAPSTIAVNETATATASASSGLTVTLASTTPTICSVSNSTVRGILPGTCTIQGTQAGNTSYNSATGNSSVTVIKANQTISLNAPSAIDWGSTGLVSATASSGLPVTITSQTPSICNVANGAISALYPGTCTVQGSQPGNQIYNPASSQSPVAIEIPAYPTPSRQLKVRVTGAGLVESVPTGISCSPYCSLFFTKGSTVQLVATPQSGAQFVRWSGGCSGRKTSCNVKMSQARNVTAIFK